jgi:hypothetical protein
MKNFEETFVIHYTGDTTVCLIGYRNLQYGESGWKKGVFL